MALVVVPTLVIAVLLPEDVYRVAWRTPKYLTTATLTTGLFAVAFFCLASLLPLLRGPRRTVSAAWPGLSRDYRAALLRASGVLFWLTIAGYLAFAAAGVMRGVTVSQLVSVFTSQDNASGDLKDTFAPIAGVTTFTQIGIAYVTVATLLLVQRRNKQVLRRLIIVVGLGAVRGFVVTERLAMIELLIPILVIVAMRWAGDPRAPVRRLVNWLPLLLLPMLIMLFSLFEYSRSWVYFREHSSGSFLEFAVERFVGYYATAFNNGQIALLHDNLPRRLPYYTLDAFWTAPGIEQLNLYDRLSPGSGGAYMFTLLKQMGNPEFNNYGGLTAPIVDWGLIGGMLWWVLAGLVLGLAYRKFANGSRFAMLVYPPLATGIFEIPRYVYWAQGRLFPAIVALALVALYASDASKPPAEVPQREVESVT